MVPAALTAGLAVVPVILGRTHPFLLSGPVWLVIAVGCLSVSQFLVWRDSEVIPVSPAHAEQLRAIARELRKEANDGHPGTEPVYTDGQTQLREFAAAFRAHFPTQTKQVEEWRSLLDRYLQCWGGLEVQMRQSVSERFRPEEGWDSDSIAKQVWDRRMDFVSNPEQASERYFRNYTASELELVGSERISYWGGDAEAVRAWAREFFVPSAGSGVLDARKAVSASKASVSRALEPLISVEGAPVRHERACPICSPARS